MPLVRLALRRPVTVAMLTLAVVAFGTVAFGRLRLNLLPDLSYPTLTIRTEYPDAAPAEVENLVTRSLEGAVGVLPGLRTTRSISRAGSSEIVLEFEWGKKMDLVSLDVRERIERIRLPREVDPPRLLRYDPSREPVVRLALWGDDDLGRLRRLAEDLVERRLETVSGVAAVEVFGGVGEEIQVEVDEGKLAAYGLTLAQVDAAIARGNVNLPGGNLRDRRVQYLLRTINEFQTPEDVARAVVISTPDGQVVRVGDLAEVRRGAQEREEILRVNGREAVELAVYKEGDANLVRVAEDVRARAEDLENDLPGLSLEVTSDRSRYIVEAVNAVRGAALWGALLAVCVLVLFLRTFTRTILVALAIPISVIATFLMMDLAGITLNLMSLGGLALGIGMLVDNAIVVLESIERRQEEQPGVKGVERGAGEMARAVTASTLTTLAVFGPVLFVEGVAGQLFRDLAATVCFSLIASLIVALALIPAAAGAMARRRTPTPEDLRYTSFREEGKGGRVARILHYPKRAVLLVGGYVGVMVGLVRTVAGWVLARLWDLVNLVLQPLRYLWSLQERLYPHVLEVAIRGRYLVLAGAVLVFGLALAALPRLGAELLPEVHQGEFSVQMRLPEGTSLETTSEVVAAVERQVKGVEGVGRALSRIGSVGAASELAETTGENLAVVTVTVAPPISPEREEEVASGVRDVMTGFPDLSYTLRRPTALSLETPVEVDVFGEDLDAVAAHARLIAETLAALPSLSDVRSSVEPGHPEILVLFDRDRLAALGLTAEEASQSLRHAVRGEVATELRMGDDRIDVRVRSAGRTRDRAEGLQSLVVAQKDGTPVLLASVADIRIERGPASIQRLHEQRVARVTARPRGVDLQTAFTDVGAALAGIQAPEAVSVAISGQSEEMGRSFSSLAKALLLAVFLVYVVLASNFESLLQPFLILFAVPLALVGVVPALMTTGHSLSILVLLGSVMLAGIVVNNAIVLVDTVNRERARGLDWEDAVRKAGALRLRPIFMTTLTTVLGLAPMAMGLGEGDELRAPMAVTVIGGLLVSTLLTLIVIPAAIVVFRPAGKRLYREADAPSGPAPVEEPAT